ncbi:MAG TPA: hypothetical protein VGV38_02185, partial [Pyrinomonadaceae bacterium]|nr:hypothetical protein [Pyrinomonadaceae bacterium]
LLANADSLKKSCSVSFPLSAAPPSEWSNSFTAAWYKATRNTQAKISGSTLQLTATVEEFDGLFPHLKPAVEAANEKYLGQERQRAEAAAEEKRKRDAERHEAQAALSSALNKLDHS